MSKIFRILHFHFISKNSNYNFQILKLKQKVCDFYFRFIR